MTDQPKKQKLYLAESKLTITLYGPDGKIKDQEVIVKKYKPSGIDPLKSLIKGKQK